MCRKSSGGQAPRLSGTRRRRQPPGVRRIRCKLVVMTINPLLTTTAFEIDGYRITRNLGVVRGITVRSRSVFGTIGASLQTLVGGNITLFTELCEKTREEAFELMLTHAAQHGANAVIGIRYDATEVMQGVTEV